MSLNHSLLSAFLISCMACDPLGTAPVDDPADDWSAVNPELGAPPAPIDVAALGPMVRGETVLVTATLPVAMDNIAIYLPTTEGGLGAGICPPPLAGDCLGIVGPLDLYGPELTTGGVATFAYEVDAAHPTSEVALQAVVLVGGAAYLSAPVSLPVVDPEEVCDNGQDDDNDGWSDCLDPDCAGDVWCIDADNDGYALADGDCDDAQWSTYPGAPDTLGDGADQSCDGVDGSDGDADGFASVASGGDDCNDSDGSVFPGAPEILYDGIHQDCQNPASLGSWGYVIRDSTNVELGKMGVDAAQTIAALQASGQTRLGVSAEDGSPAIECPERGEGIRYVGAQGAGHNWCGMLEIVEAAHGTDIEIYVALGNRNPSQSTPHNRWLDLPGVQYCDGTGTPGCLSHWDEQVKEGFKASFVAAAEELATVSLEPGMDALIGMTINDLGGYICGPDHEGLIKSEGCYDNDDLAEITAAGKAINPDFKFWAYTESNTSLPRTMPGSHILGQTALTEATLPGVVASPTMGPDKTLALEIDLPLNAPPNAAQLRFLYSDPSHDSSDHGAGNEDMLFKFVEVENASNRITLLYEDVVGAQWIQRFDEDIAPHLIAGDNTIRIGLRTDPGLPGGVLGNFSFKQVLIWGLELELDGEVLEELDTSYTCPDDCVGPWATGSRGYYASAPTVDSPGSTDGVFFRMYTETDLYDAAVVEHLLTTTRERIGEASMEPVAVALGPQDKWIDPVIRSEEIELLAQLSDHVHVYGFPLYYYSLDEQDGIFGMPATDEFLDDWNAATTWPGEHGCVVGWYQEWLVSDPGPVSDTVCLTVKEAEGPVHQLTVDQGEGTDVLLSTTDVPDLIEETTGGPYNVWQSELTIDPSQPLRLRMETVLDCGLAPKVIRLRAVHSATGCDWAPSTYFPTGTHFADWEFVSGVSDPDSLTLYCEVGERLQTVADWEPWVLEGTEECVD